MTFKTSKFTVERLAAIAVLMLNSALVGGQNLKPFVVVLGTTQDGGSPHIGCNKMCCKSQSGVDTPRRFVTSLGIADPVQGKWWLVEATPSIVEQLRLMQSVTKSQFSYLPDGIFITHAHIGHYSGLMYLGREALGSKNIPVYVLPRLAAFLSHNGPWSQLVALENIKIQVVKSDSSVVLSKDVSVAPFPVPHREEYSETAGYTIITSSKKYLFIPDIDKWSTWNRDLVKIVATVDVAFLDATFYSSDELPGRNVSEVPHPLVTETIQILNGMRLESKIQFIHFNHTNPLLWNKDQQAQFLKSGYGLSVTGRIY